MVSSARESGFVSSSPLSAAGDVLAHHHMLRRFHSDKGISLFLPILPAQLPTPLPVKNVYLLGWKL